MKSLKGAVALTKQWISIFHDWVWFIAKKPTRLRFLIDWWQRRNYDATFKQPIPWMTFESVEWIQSHIKKTDTLFEWGSGGSTFFFAQRIAKVTSIEHDETWYKTLQEHLKRGGLLNVDYRLVAPEPIKDETIDPVYRSTSQIYDGQQFHAYCSAIDEIPNESLDIIIADGRARNGCIVQAIPKLIPGGILILDNAERDIYAVGKNLLSDWTHLDFFGPGPYNRRFWQTSIYLRPMK